MAESLSCLAASAMASACCRSFCNQPATITFAFEPDIGLAKRCALQFFALT